MKRKPQRAKKNINNSNKEKKASTTLIQTKPRKWFFPFLFLIPILFFLLLEIILVLFNYGYDYKQWTEVKEGKLLLNPYLGHKYFYVTQNVPISSQDVFDKIKKEKTFRVFVLGESSGAGYPFVPNGSFSRYLRDRLTILYPNSNIEVINCSMTAINSYAIRDMVSGILEEKPDLILIYAGHNEYYGALGIGSTESLGTSRKIINLIISLEKFRTFQLVRNTLKSIVNLFSGDSDSPSGTLMARMAQNQYIGLGSETYEKGVSQFEGNMEDILELINDAKLPVILGTLTCNLKDQYPFVSIPSDSYPPADKVYIEAKQELIKNNIRKSDSLFLFAKDLDALRFRAPSQINKIIFKLSQKYNAAVLDIDSAFKTISPDHIVGDNLMTDHLHPTLKGYQFMGKIFFEKMKELNYLPKSTPGNLSDEEQDSITVSNFNFTKLDSVIADYRIKLLKNDWPFVDKNNKVPDYKLLQPKTEIDSIAAQLMDDKINWEEAHRKAAAHYLKERDLNSFLNEMDNLISQYSLIADYYGYAANALLPIKEYDEAYKYLIKGYEMEPNAFNTKWLGTINLYKNKLDSAEKYLNQSIKFDNNDAQVWYNLAGIYVYNKNYKKALELVNKAITLNPKYSDAIALQRQLQNAVN